MKIIYFGSGEIGIPTLEALCDAHDVALVITQPDRPAGRKRILTPTPIGTYAQQHNLNLIKTENANADNVLNTVRQTNADANIVFAFGQKMSDELISLTTHGPTGTMNLHTSLLPKYRGAGPINAAILNGETVTGVTVIHLAQRMDAGPMLAHVTTPIPPLETAGELHDRLARLAPPLILKTLNDLEQNTLNIQHQDESLATHAPKLSKADGIIDFNTPAEHIRRKVHGLTPWPGVTTHYQLPNNDKSNPLKLCRVKVIENTTGTPAHMTQDGIIPCSQNAIQLLEVQAPGKKVMSYEDFSRGNPLPPGTQFHSKPI